MKTKFKLKLKKEWIILIAAVLVIGIIITVCLVVNNNKKDDKNNVKEVSGQIEKDPYINHLPEARAEYNNEDIVGEVEIPSLEIKEYILQSDNNDYYLKHDINKQYTIKGDTFMDYRVTDVDDFREINIFGHNVDPRYKAQYPDLPFEKLLQYQEEEFFNNAENRKLIYRTDKDEYQYEIFMVSRIEKADNEHMMVYYDGQEYLDHMDRLRSKALLDTNVEITEDDKIFEMQTCLFNPPRLLLIMAKRVA